MYATDTNDPVELARQRHYERIVGVANRRDPAEVAAYLGQLVKNLETGWVDDYEIRWAQARVMRVAVVLIPVPAGDPQ